MAWEGEKARETGRVEEGEKSLGGRRADALEEEGGKPLPA
jgi:hypothetical protein